MKTKKSIEKHANTEIRSPLFILSIQIVQCSEGRNGIKQEGKNSIKFKRLASIYCCLCARH